MGGCGPCKGQKTALPIECTVSTVKHCTSIVVPYDSTFSAPSPNFTSHYLIHVPVLAIRHSHLYRRRKKTAGKALKSAEFERLRDLSDIRIAEKC